MKLKPGDQVAYIPPHTGVLDHPDVEYGFVTNITPSSERDSFFCRYFRDKRSSKLRTTANSEATPGDMLIPYIHKPQSFIDNLMKELGYE